MEPQNAKEIIIKDGDTVLFRGSAGAEVLFTRIENTPDPGNGDPIVIEVGERIPFVPVWELGTATVQPNIGSGQLKGELIILPLKDGRFGVRANIDIVTARLPISSHPGVGSGSYEFYMPPMWAHLNPAAPILDANGNLTEHDFVRGAGGAVFWIAGSGVKHFTGACKWTFREWRTGGPALPRPKILVIVDGDEWKPDHPKQLVGADWNMALTIEWGL